MHTTLEYRTFDELLDSVKIDLKTYDLEGMIEGQELLKIAIRINRELGLKLNPNQQQCIEIYDNKGRLPMNFHVLNYALLCEGETNVSTSESVLRKTFMEDASKMILAIAGPSGCKSHDVTRTLFKGINVIKHDLKTEDVIVQAVEVSTGEPLEYTLMIVNDSEVSIVNDSVSDIEGIKITILGNNTKSSDGIAELQESISGNPTIKYLRSSRETVTYSQAVPIEIKNERTVNKIHNSHAVSNYSAYLKTNFIHTNFGEGVVYLNYSGTMEDMEGNLLVLDHPFVNEYYEYAIKERIFENMFANGEATVLSRLQMYSQKIRAVKNNAFSYVNTPDFRVLKNIHDVNKRAMHHKYYNMFKS